MKRQFSLVALLFSPLIFLSLADAKERSLWNPETSWQKQLPAIKVEEKGKPKEYSFVELIRADGYLCPGSAKAYKALKDALPLLFGNAVPVKGDFKITYSPAAECTEKVFKHFMQGFSTEKHLEADLELSNKNILISRLSTGQQVKITYSPIKEKNGEGGDIILHMEDGNGITITKQTI